MFSTNSSIREFWRVSSTYMASPKEGHIERSKRRHDEETKLKAAGFKTEYRFPVEQEDRARGKAEEIYATTGVRLSVGKASYL